MKSHVGIRQAKANLSMLMKRVSHGAEIIITDRGRPIGKITPIKKSHVSLAVFINDLESRGIIEPMMAQPRPLPSPIPGLGDQAQIYLQESRA